MGLHVKGGRLVLVLVGLPVELELDERSVAVAAYVMQEQAELKAWTSSQFPKLLGMAIAAVVVPDSHSLQAGSAPWTNLSSMRLR